MDAPALIVICGYPGVGKSTVASLIADRTSARIYDSDHVRKELFPDPTYSRDESRTVYDELLAQGREALEDGETVVLDATFSRRSRREEAESIAEDLGINTVFVRVACEEDVVKRRISERDGISDADFEVYQIVKESFDTLEREHVTIDNSGSILVVQNQIDRIFADC